MAVATVTSVNVKQAVPFFGVTNMESSLRFYVDGLGFKMKNCWMPDRDEDHPEDRPAWPAASRGRGNDRLRHGRVRKPNVLTQSLHRLD
jgi:hypothetical protein